MSERFEPKNRQPGIIQERTVSAQAIKAALQAKLKEVIQIVGKK